SYFLYKDTSITNIYTLSLHDALPIFIEIGEIAAAQKRNPTSSEIPRSDRYAATLTRILQFFRVRLAIQRHCAATHTAISRTRKKDRKSTRLNSSHRTISYAVFCLKKK